MTVITDTREQKPYWITKMETLIVGDYTTDILVNRFHIERKTLQDLYGTLVQGNARFKAELFRAAYDQIKIVVFVEGSKLDFINKNFPKGSDRKFSSHGLESLIKTFERKYYLEFHWFRSRSHAKKETLNRLYKEETYIIESKRKANYFKKPLKAVKNRVKK